MFKLTERNLVPCIKHRKSDQTVGFQLFDLVTKGQLSCTFKCISLTTIGSTGNQMRFHRADFHGVLLSHLSPSCTTYNAKRLKSYIQPRSRKSPIKLIFQDGSTATCDVLIGADGIKSSVRPCMMRELAEVVGPHEKQSVLSCMNPIWSGVTAYRTLIPAEKLRARCPNHRVFAGGITQVNHLLVTWHSIDLAVPSFLVLGKRCCETFLFLFIIYVVLRLTHLSSSLHTQFLLGNTSISQVSRFNLISLTRPMKPIHECLVGLSTGGLTATGSENSQLNSLLNLSKTSKKTRSRFSRSVIPICFTGHSLTISTVCRKRHALGCTHRENITIHKLRTSCTLGRCCPCNATVPGRWCWSEYRGQWRTFVLPFHTVLI